MNNPVNNQEKLGLVDNISTKHIEEAFLKAELEASAPAIKAPQPATRPQPYEPDVYYGQQGLEGVVRTTQDYETWEQFETRVAKQHADRGLGKSVYNTAPTHSGYRPYVDLTEPPKPSQQQIEDLKRQQDVNDIQQRLTLLKQAETKLRKDLERNVSVQRTLRQRLDDY